jgi:hopanoid biosynthesis associated protein HpnK
MTRQLILNADDFGWSKGVNEAVAALYEAGIVTSTSLMVGCPAADEAVELARARPGLAVGLHATLAGAPALVPHAENPRICDAKGWLPRDWRRAVLGYSLLPGWRRELRRELEAQFSRFQELGLPWSHVDTHLHTGLTPAVFQALLPLCDRFGVRAVRIPEDDFELARRYAPAESGGQALEGRVMRWLCARQRARLRAAGLWTTDRCYGYFRSGKLDEGYLCRLVAALPEGASELHCHPDFSTESGRAEYAALRSDAFREALEARQVRLSTWFSLAEGGPERNRLRENVSGAIQR